jgi:hypothetical protein
MAANAEMYPELTPQVTEVLTVDGRVHFPDASVDTPRSRPSSWEWHAMWRVGCDYGCDAESASPISWERAPGWDSSLTATSIMSNSRSACFAVIPMAVAPKRPSIARQDSMYLRAGSGPNLSRRRGSTPTPATQARQLVVDVIGVALVEIGLRNAGGYLLSRPIHDIAESGHAEDYDTSRANETNA